MKIGILTYPLNSNYGNLLQAYALMTFLKKRGYEVELIDKRVKKSSNSDKFKKYIKIIIAYIFKNLLYKKYSHFYANMGFSSFIRKNIKPRTSKIYDENHLIDIIGDNKYDIIITGSDQIWRYEYIKNNIPLYFLSFVPDNTTKISYSASFGVDYWQFDNIETEKIKAYLSRFNGISVREDSAVKLLKENINIDAKHIIDPTLLLNIKDYLYLSRNLRYKLEEKYLFCYMLDEDIEKVKIVDFFLDSFKMNSRIDFTLTSIKKNNVQIKPENPVESWLYHMYHSEFVITDSYHGVVFSILFNKQFLVIPNRKRGLTRFTSILKMFDLEERMLEEINDVEKILNNDINWNNVNSILAKGKKEAEDFIMNSITNA